jgi:hypothetical protein
MNFSSEPWHIILNLQELAEAGENGQPMSHQTQGCFGPQLQIVRFLGIQKLKAF